MTSGPVKVDHVDCFLLLTLNQPEILNPLGPEVTAALGAALTAAEQNEAVRAIVLRGAGEVFSAGGNLAAMQDRLNDVVPDGGVDPIVARNRPFGSFLDRLTRYPKPVVVAVQGAAMGGGAGLVCAADVAIACAGTRFSFTETSLGLVPAQILPTVVARIGAAKARRLMLTAERIDADEAQSIGSGRLCRTRHAGDAADAGRRARPDRPHRAIGAGAYQAARAALRG